MYNYLVVIQQFDKMCFCCTGMQKQHSRLHWESRLANFHNLVLQVCDLTSRERDVICKMCEIEEIMIYGDIQTGTEGNTAFRVKNTSEFEARDPAVNLLSLQSG